MLFKTDLFTEPNVTHNARDIFTPEESLVRFLISSSPTLHFQVVTTLGTWLSRSLLIIAPPLRCYLSTCRELFDKPNTREWFSERLPDRESRRRKKGLLTWFLSGVRPVMCSGAPELEARGACCSVWQRRNQLRKRVLTKAFHTWAAGCCTEVVQWPVWAGYLWGGQLGSFLNLPQEAGEQNPVCSVKPFQ